MPRSQSAWLFFPAMLLRGSLALALPVFPLMVMILVATVVGRLVPSPTAWLEAVDCSQPCWQGLRLGETTGAEALASIERQNLTDLDTLVDNTPPGVRQTVIIEWKTLDAPIYEVRMRFDDDVLMRLDLYPQGRVLLGDVFAAFGPPPYARLCQFGNAFAPVASSTLSATLYFFDGTVEVWAVRSSQAAPPDRTSFEAFLLGPLQDHAANWRVSPGMQVSRITYRADPFQLEGLGPMGASPWRGFDRVAQDSYCQ